MALTHVFLDFGGTLAHERASRPELYAAAGRARGLTVDAAAMAERMAATHASLPQEVAGAFRYSDTWFRAFIEDIFHAGLGLARDELPGLESELFARFSDAETFRVFPGARELIDTLLARGLGVGIVSNWSARLPALLERLGLAEGLDPILASAAVRLEKPDPAIFTLALERAGVRPEEALHAGNHLREDIECARTAGLDALWVQPEAPGVRPPECAGSLAELADLVLSRLP